MKIRSKEIKGMVWLIDTNGLSKEDISYIENLDLELHFDDTTYNHWVQNIKLPSERWIEEIEVNFEVTVAKAIVL